MCVKNPDRYFWSIALLFVLVLCLGASDGTLPYKQTPFASGMSLYVPGEILVKYKTSSVPSDVKTFQTKQGIRTIKKFRSMNVHHLKLPPHLSVEEAIKIYRRDASVEYAEPNYLRCKAVLPNDDLFDLLWGLHNTEQSVLGTSGTADADIDAPEAWDIATGSDGIIIAVIDSGVDYTHPDLSANIWTNENEIPDNDTDDDGNGYIDDIRGWDFVNDDNDPMDYDGHGTHVSGTIAAKGNNDTGVVGVCWQAKIMPLRFLDSLGWGDVADELLAIQYAIDNGAHIINMSSGAYGYSTSEYNFISDANDAGILLVAAAGNGTNDNDDPDTENRFYPASYDLDNIISVAATDQNDNLCSFSNYGANTVHAAAPGNIILSTVCSARQIIWSDNFNNGISPWTTGGTNNTWAITTTSPYSLSDSPEGNYQNSTNSWAQSPVIDFSSYKGAILEFKIYGESQQGQDKLYVESSTNGSTWTSLPIVVDYETLYEDGLSGSISGWETVYVDLAGYGGANTFFLRFRFYSTPSAILNLYDGWYIDDVTITVTSDSHSENDYAYYSGTSMAAPHVSGLAALIWAYKPSITHLQVRDTILNSVDESAGLSGKVATGGRINAYNAFAVDPPAAPSDLSAHAVSSSRIDLSWQDNSNNEFGFIIERKQEGGTYAEVATVGKNIISYTNTGLAASTMYYYQVKAYSLGSESASSYEASATTLEPSDEKGSGICYITAAENNPASPVLVVTVLLWISILETGLFYRKNKS